jgi:AraC-like DNA-binding protein
MEMKSSNPVQVFVRVPRLVLQPFVKRFLVAEFCPAHRDTHLPEIGPVAAFTFRGRCRINGYHWAPAAAFGGMYETTRSHEHLDNHAILLVFFEPMGAAAFLRPALEDFSGEITDLNGILGRRDELDRLHECLATAPSHHRRIMLVEDFLLARLQVASPDPLVTAAVEWIGHRPKATRIEQLSRYIGLSQSALERRFRSIIGLSPKRFASVVRFRHAVRLMHKGMDLASVANTVGYFDQSHFTNHFRRVTGLAPTAYFKENRLVDLRRIGCDPADAVAHTEAVWRS